MSSFQPAWLFARGDQSIRVTRLPTALALVVCGPGHSEQSHHFDSEAALEQFWGWYEQRLMRDGWALVPDRRSRGDGPGERRSGGEQPPVEERRRRARDGDAPR